MSFRLEPDPEARLERAARAEGVPASRFIRLAIQERCDRVLGQTQKEEAADMGRVTMPAIDLELCQFEQRWGMSSREVFAHQALDQAYASAGLNK